MASIPPEPLRQEPSNWTAWLPNWGRLGVVVLENGTELAAGLSAEFRLQHQIASSFLPAGPASAGSAAEQPVEFVSVTGTTAALQLIRERTIVAVVLNLESHCRESLVLLRQLLAIARCPNLAAVGTPVHEELRTILFEADCPLLLTNPPFDVPLTGWLNRILLHRSNHSATSREE